MDILLHTRVRTQHVHNHNVFDRADYVVGYECAPLDHQRHFVDYREAKQTSISFTMKTIVSLVVLAALCLSVQAAPARSTFYKVLQWRI